MDIGRICLIATSVCSVMGLTTLAHAKKRGDESWELHSHFSAVYGPAKYSSKSSTTNIQNSIDGNQPGVLGEVEFWKNRRWGILVDSKLFTAEVKDSNKSYQGKAINLAYTGVNVAYRVAGRSGMDGAQLYLFTGPGVNYFSVLRGYPNPNVYDVLQANVLGAKAGARVRISFSKEWAIDFGGSYFIPYTVLGYGRKALNSSGTSAISGWAGFEHKLFSTWFLSFGYLFESNKLSFSPSQADKTENVEFSIGAPMLGIRISL